MTMAKGISRKQKTAARAARGNGKSRPFPVIDADSHVFEPAAIWEKYLDKSYRILARSAFSYDAGEDGTPTIILNGKPAKPPVTRVGSFPLGTIPAPRNRRIVVL
jgi:hypothetical protein